MDDEEFCLSATKSFLKILGVNINKQVDFCIDGQEAVNKLVYTYENHMSYKIIFTDFKMPILDGIEATKQMRKILADEY